MKMFLSVALVLLSVPSFAQSRHMLAEGTEVRVRTDQNIPAKPAVGSAYSATVSEDVQNSSGAVIIPRGAPARLVAVREENGKNAVLDLRSVNIRGRRYVLAAQGSKTGGAGLGANKRTAKYVGGGAAIGALLGAIAGGGKGAAIEPPLGAPEAQARKSIPGVKRKFPPRRN